VLAETNTKTMQVFLDKFAETIKADEHVALFLDSAGWHRSNDLVVPACITLMPLPPYSPELNPVERIWEYLKERFLSHRLLDDFDAIVDAACIAWNKMTAKPGCIASLTWLPWEPKAEPSAPA
jgi:transposase